MLQKSRLPIFIMYVYICMSGWRSAEWLRACLIGLLVCMSVWLVTGYRLHSICACVCLNASLTSGRLSYWLHLLSLYLYVYVWLISGRMGWCLGEYLGLYIFAGRCVFGRLPPWVTGSGTRAVRRQIPMILLVSSELTSEGRNSTGVRQSEKLLIVSVCLAT